MTGGLLFILKGGVLEKIVIEGGVAKVVSEETVFECTTESMLERLTSRLSIKMKFMPRNTMYYERRENQKSVFVIEVPPRMTKINWHEGNGKIVAYRVSMPFLYFFVVVDETSNNVISIYPVSSKEPLRDGKAKIFKAPISNVHSGGMGHMCMGDIKIQALWPLFQKIDYMIDQIFHAKSNADITVNLPSELKSFKDWHETSLKDPLIWSKAEYQQHTYKTFDGIVEKILYARVDG